MREKKNVIIGKKLLGAAISVFILSIGYLYVFRNYCRLNVFDGIYSESIADVNKGTDGKVYLINDAGNSFIRINEMGEADLSVSGKTEVNRSFVSGFQVASDSQGNIYISNKIAAEDAPNGIGEENIVVFNEKGKKIGTYCDIEYATPVFRPSIVELITIKGKVYAVLTDDCAITIKDVLDGSIKKYALEEANLFVSNVGYDENADVLYASLLNGEVLSFGEEGKRTVYKTASDDSETVIWDIAVSNSGELYASNIGTNSIVKIQNGELITEAVFEYPLYQLEVYPDGGLLLGSSDGYSVYRDGEETFYDSFSLNKRISGLVYASYFVFLLGIISALVIVLYVFLSYSRRASERTKQVTGLAVFSLLLTFLFCLLINANVSEDKIQEKVDVMIDDAVLINSLISTDDFKQLNHCSDFGSESYEKIKAACDSVILNQGKTPGNSYVIIYTLGKDDAVYARYSTEENYGCNFPYIWTDGTDERYVYDTAETIVFGADEVVSDSVGTYLFIYVPLTDDDGTVIGVIEVGCNYDELMSDIKSMIFDMSLSIFALTVVILLILLEIMEYNDAKKEFAYRDDGLIKKIRYVPLKAYRVIVFLVFFITNITTPFLSIYALELSDYYMDITGLSKEILAAIPISAEVLFGAVFSLCGSRIIGKLRERKAGILGAVLFTIGLIIRFVFPDLLILTIGNGMQGAGWGIVLLIVNSKIAREENEEKKEKGFTDYNVALQNGINSGVVAGGFFLLFLDHKGVLIMAAALSMILLFFVYEFILDDEMRTIKEKTSVKDYLRFIFSKKIFMYFVLIVVPVIAASYYLNFLYPILADDMGISETLIGYSYLFNGLVAIMFSNMIVRFVSKHFSKKISLMLASLIYLLTFVLIGVFDNIIVLLLALVLLAVSDSFGYVVQETFYTELKETQNFGYERAMGVYSLFENLAQAFGSLIFGYILAVGVKKGLIAYGIVIGVCGILFAVFAGRKRKEA